MTVLQVLFGVPFGMEVDMWSVGCILAELLIGGPFMQGRNSKSILQKVKHANKTKFPLFSLRNQRKF